jgi:ethanolamine ammonia-lyase small subunit
MLATQPWLRHHQGEGAMTAAGPPLRSIRDLRHLTPARVGLGRSGASLPTQALLEFTLDHARARDAVHANFDAAAISAGLDALGLEALAVSSRTTDRKDYLRRPDLGRKLAPASQDLLARRHGPPCDCTLVIADGLSPSAVGSHAIELVRNLYPRLTTAGMTVGPVVVATGARVALGDEIGAIVGARMIAMLIGERPGLSAPGSLGAYLTFAPKPGLSDADRNCVSNIHASGLPIEEAAFKIAWLVREALARQVSGVALKDESAIQPTLQEVGHHKGA